MKMLCNLINLGKKFYLMDLKDNIYKKKNFYFLLKTYNNAVKTTKLKLNKIINSNNQNFQNFLQKKFVNLDYIKKQQTKIVINSLQMKLLYFSIKKKKITNSKIELFLDPVIYPSKKLTLNENFKYFSEIKNFINHSSSKILYNKKIMEKKKKNAINYFCHQCQLIYDENLIKSCNKKNGKTPPTEQNSVIDFGRKKKKKKKNQKEN